jgi:hypothetical protein
MSGVVSAEPTRRPESPVARSIRTVREVLERSACHAPCLAGDEPIPHHPECPAVRGLQALDFIEAEIARMRKEFNDEMREAQRDCARAYTEGRLEGQGEERGTW